MDGVSTSFETYHATTKQEGAIRAANDERRKVGSSTFPGLAQSAVRPRMRRAAAKSTGREAWSEYHSRFPPGSS